MSRGAQMSILGLWQWDHSIFDLMQYPSFQDGETVHEFTTEEKEMLNNNLMAECAELEILYPNPVVMKNMIGLWSAKELPTWIRIYKAALAEYNPIENYHRTENSTETLNNYEQHTGTDSNQASGSDTSNGGYSDTNSGTDSNQASGTDSNQASGSDTTNGGATDTNSGTDTTTGKVVGYDSNILVTHDETDMVHGHVVTNIHNDGTTYGKKDTMTYGKKDTITYGHILTNTHNDGTTYGRKDTFTHGEKIDHGGTIKHDTEAFGNIGVTTSQQMLESELELAPKLNVFNYIIESFKNRFCILVY